MKLIHKLAPCNHTILSLHEELHVKKNLSCSYFSSIGGHSEQESTLNQLLVEMDGELTNCTESVDKRTK